MLFLKGLQALCLHLYVICMHIGFQEGHQLPEYLFSHLHMGKPRHRLSSLSNNSLRPYLHTQMIMKDTEYYEII